MALVLNGDGPITGISSLTFPSNNGSVSGLGTGAIPSLAVGNGSLLQIAYYENKDGYTNVSGGSRGTPGIANGYQLFNPSFTPKSATSKIVVQTSSVMIQEESNGGNIGWLAAFYDTTVIGSNSGTSIYTTITNALNFGYYSLCHSTPSWGTTAKNINVRAGMDGSTSYSFQINGNSYSNTATAYTYIGLIIMEIAQ